MVNQILLAIYMTGGFYFWRARLRASSNSSLAYRAIMSAIIGLSWPAAAIVIVSENLTKMYAPHE